MNKKVFDGDNINLKALLDNFLEYKKTVLSIVSLVTLIFAFWALSLPNIYTSSSVLKIAGGNDGTTSFSQYEGLANLAGVNLPQSNASNFTPDYFYELARSRSFFEHILNRSDIRPELIAAKYYDPESMKLVFDPSIYSEKNKKWNPKKLDGKIEPTYIMTHSFFIDKHLDINIDPKTKFITVSISHISPIFAKDTLSLLITEANLIEKEKAQNESEKIIDFLRSEIQKTNNSELKYSFNKVLEKQIENLVLSEVNNEYLVETIDEPFIPEEKSGPSRIFIILIGSIIGFAISIISVVARSK